ncbi:hypothetical protein NDU88_005685 [Pleurodeles waltl]|uniref:Uncharacterized protein n=1 Tax=Pleurodeles waltl TaxID=8319 RepID=A0AAV7L562_PLEWA|nr:hypothetical protein NDU88_005685 [Pleurodeles waltl]
MLQQIQVSKSSRLYGGPPGSSDATPQAPRKQRTHRAGRSQPKRHAYNCDRTYRPLLTKTTDADAQRACIFKGGHDPTGISLKTSACTGDRPTRATRPHGHVSISRSTRPAHLRATSHTVPLGF